MSEFADRNTITLRGRPGEAPKLIASGERSTAVGLRLAVDDGYYDRQTGRWVERPTIWHDVIVFGALAENTFDSLMDSEDNGKGLLVTITGSFSDDSYTRESFRPDGEDITIRRLKLRAVDVACSFRRATAIVRKKSTQAPGPARWERPRGRRRSGSGCGATR